MIEKIAVEASDDGNLNYHIWWNFKMSCDGCGNEIEVLSDIDYSDERYGDYLLKYLKYIGWLYREDMNSIFCKECLEKWRKEISKKRNMA